MKCNHEYNDEGIHITANPTATCKKCGEEYECDNTGKPHLIELLGSEYSRYNDGGVSYIKKK